jgi:ketosteroid isomerase-like protein
MERVKSIASWIAPPLLMSLCYTILALTSETDTTGKAWMAIGFMFVLILWMTFRLAVEGAGLSRALAVGDADKVLAITNKQLAKRANDQVRAPYLIHQALAYELRGDATAALASVEAAKPVTPHDKLLQTAVMMLALVEAGRVTDARAFMDELDERAAATDRRLQIVAHHYAHLARGRVLIAEGEGEAAKVELAKISDDVRAGHAIRARAKKLSASLMQ